MLNKVQQFIESHQLMAHDKRYLVAVSGGADSVCLLLMLKQMGYAIDAVHCNFHLRGEESNRDEAFVKDLCKKYNIELHIIHFDTETYAKIHHVSIEMAARQLRYRYFEELRQDIGADDICVAHHQDDSVETVLINLIRGTGIHGLGGIRPRNGHIVRPLLCLNRDNIEKWLHNKRQAFVTDSTNLKADVVRNKLRLNVLPILHQINPHANDGILITARRTNEAVAVYDAAIKQTLGRLIHADSIDINMLIQEPSPESVLYEWLSPMGFQPMIIEQISQSLPQLKPGSEWISDTHQLTISRGRLCAELIQAPRPTLRIPEEGNYAYEENTMFHIRVTPGKKLIRSNETTCLDAAKVHFPLTIRPVQKGDRFQPYGMKGTKLVSDYLTDRHLNIFEKRRTLVVCDANQQIIWLVGHRPDANFCLTDNTTETLSITIEIQKCEGK